MTKIEIEITKKYSKALKGGKEMLERAKNLREIGENLIKNNETGSSEWEKGSLIVAISWEMVNFYTQMFN